VENHYSVTFVLLPIGHISAKGTEIMRWAIAVFLLVTLPAQAGEVFLIPEHNPKPIYPRALSRAGITGDVKVGFTAKADGSVSEIAILRSDHPELAQAVREAIAQWRFKPWKVDDKKPAAQEIVAPMIFRLEAPEGAHQWVQQLKCRELNAHLNHMPEYAWIDSAPFHYLRSHLSSGVFQSQLSEDKRLALIARLNRSVEGVVWRCRQWPVSRFTRFLPEEVRQLL